MSLNKKVGILKRQDLSEILEKDFQFFVRQLASNGFVPIIIQESFNLSEIDIDVIVSCGGDGTMLTASRMSAKYNIPVIGINYGNLGFITPISINEHNKILQILKDNMFNESKHTLLSLNNSNIIALNEILIQRTSNKLMEFEVYVDKQFAYSSRADGILIATPTGSTAYSLSAGGSIIDNSSKVFQIVPLMPQTLSNKPLIISDDSEIDIISKDEAAVLVDGIEVNHTKEFNISKYKNTANFLLPKGLMNNFEALRTKLHWQIEHGK